MKFRARIKAPSSLHWFLSLILECSQLKNTFHNDEKLDYFCDHTSKGLMRLQINRMDVCCGKEQHRNVRGKIHLFIFLERKYRVDKLTSGLLKGKLIFKSAKSSQE